jgi:RNase H-fold protein (predicted Holliday junction resolvase)
MAKILKIKYTRPLLPEPDIIRVSISNLMEFNLQIPDCQREKEWDDDMYMNAIDSIMNNIDIGQIIVTFNTINNSYEILDGQHRYEAINKFINRIDYEDNITEIFMSKRITVCKYNNLTQEQQKILYMRINSGLEQNIEHMEKINEVNNMKDFMEEYDNKFGSKDNLNLIINTLLYIIQDYYYNGEANVVIKNLTKKNHFLKNLNKMDLEYGLEDTQNIIGLTKYILDEINNEKYLINKYLDSVKKIKNTVVTTIIYHILHENYEEIKNKTFKYNDILDKFYFKIWKVLLDEKKSKIKDNFTIICNKYNEYIHNQNIINNNLIDDTTETSELSD